MAEDRRKINWLLILQGWAMLWVVIGHSGPSPTLEDYPKYALTLWHFAYSFHMPLFIMISGFLFFLTRIDNKKWTYWAMMKEKFIRFGIPFVVFTLIGMMLKTIFSESVDRGTTFSFHEFTNAILYPYNGPMREFWFIATIMWLFSFFPIWKIVLMRNWSIITTLICLVFINIWHPSTDFLAIRSLCNMAIYFFIGILFARFYKNTPKFIKQKKFIIVSFLIGVAIYLAGRSFDILLFAPLGGAMFSLSIALLFDEFYPKAFASFRNYTYQIYLLGLFFNVLVSIIRSRYGLPFGPMYVISMLLGVYMPVFISKVLEIINWSPLLICVGLKPNK